jgi:hypothetical protein
VSDFRYQEKAPIIKKQISNNFQYSIIQVPDDIQIKTGFGNWNLSIDNYLAFEICDLEFFFPIPFSTTLFYPSLPAGF